MKLYQLTLTNEKDSIVLEEYKDKEVAEYMLKWYTNKSRFFNGTFEIVETIR